MKCSLLTLSCALDGELATPRQAELEAHLVSCDRCRTGLQYLREETERIAGLPRLALPDLTIEALLSRTKVTEPPIAAGAALPPLPVAEGEPATASAADPAAEPGGPAADAAGESVPEIEVPGLSTAATAPDGGQGATGAGLAAPPVGLAPASLPEPEPNLDPAAAEVGPTGERDQAAEAEPPTGVGAVGPVDLDAVVPAAPPAEVIAEEADGSAPAPPAAEGPWAEGGSADEPGPGRAATAELADSEAPATELTDASQPEDASGPAVIDREPPLPTDAPVGATGDQPPPTPSASTEATAEPATVAPSSTGWEAFDPPPPEPTGLAPELPTAGTAGPELVSPSALEPPGAAAPAGPPAEGAVPDPAASPEPVSAEDRGPAPGDNGGPEPITPQGWVPPPLLASALPTAPRPPWRAVNLEPSDLPAAYPNQTDRLDAVAASTPSRIDDGPTLASPAPARAGAGDRATVTRRRRPPPERRPIRPAIGGLADSPAARVAAVGLLAVAVLVVGWRISRLVLASSHAPAPAATPRPHHGAGARPSPSAAPTPPPAPTPTPTPAPTATPAPASAIPSLTGTSTLAGSGSGYTVQTVRYGEHSNGLWVVFQLVSGQGAPEVVTGFANPTTLYVELGGVAPGTPVPQAAAGSLVTHIAPAGATASGGAVYVLRLRKAATVSTSLLPGSLTGPSGERVILVLK